mmetsp:Transcript_13994/g.16302  ORF Transcript_13994/g.16302 Transcript_13994/m.16302 type:complete len:433 (+) Transcript_13994:59-1357(+)
MAEQIVAEPMGNEKLKIVAYTIPMMGHALPLLSLCRSLVSRGHRVVFAVSTGLGHLDEMCSSSGIHYAGLEDGLTSEYLKQQDPTGPVFKEFTEVDEKPLAKVVEDESPDVVVADYASGAPFQMCKERKIPLVLNLPLPGTLVKKFRMLNDIPLLGKIVPYMLGGGVRDALIWIRDNCAPVILRTLVIVNSSPAMDGELGLPSNIFMSGPLDGFEKKELHPEKHADLLAFLGRARAANMPVAYITTGSLMNLTQEQVLALYEGFAACNLWVVWSLKKDKQELLPKELPERFYVNAWIPQAELLQRPELLCVLTHCGWGGTLECMLSAKAVICYAGFGDQMENAQLLHSRGCGPIVKNPVKSTAKDIQAAVEDVLKNRESYCQKAQEVSNQLRQSPGPVACAEQIEEMVKNGRADLPHPYHLGEKPDQGCSIS